MNSTPTVLPSRQNFAHRRPEADIATVYAIELFIVVMILNALLILAGAANPEIASLYATVT